MKKVLIAVLLLVFAAPAVFAIEGCKQCVPYEVMGTVCYVYDFIADTSTVYTCGYPPSTFNPLHQFYGSEVVQKETGRKCQPISATYVPSMWMNTSHTTAYTSLWNDLLNSTPGTSFTGPAASYNMTMSGGTSCTPASYYTTVHHTPVGDAEYTRKNWVCGETGSYCQANVYVYGTDGE